MMLYVFACVGVEIITKNDANEDIEFKMLVDTFWCDIPTSMLTLVSFVNLDSISSMYVPMIKKDITLVFYFMPFILVVSIALMNLVTAVIVEGAIEQAHADR